MERNLKTIEEARKGLLRSQRKHLESIWDEAISQTGGNAYKTYFIGNLTPRLIEGLESALCRPINAKKQLVKLGYIRHINKRHGAGGTAVKGQIPITKELFALIPDVLDNFDFVDKGHKTTDGDGVLIRKRYSDGIAVLISAVPAKGSLEIRSFRIESK